MVRLEIPFQKKEEAKEIARKNNKRLIWKPEERSWYFEGREEELPTELKEYLGILEEKKEYESVSKTPNSLKHKVLATDYTYMPFATKAGARWNKEWKVCVFSGDKLPIELTGFEPPEFSYEEWAQSIL